MRDPLLQSRARRLRNQATDVERLLWRYLRHRQIAGHRFRRQVPVAGFIADFACLEAKVIVELDGGQHLERAGYDKQRDRVIEAQGFLVLRFWDNQVFQETQAVVEQIVQALEARCPHPSSPPQAGEGSERADSPTHAQQVVGVGESAAGKTSAAH
jgi:very-short-patch-repair endonuclease